MRGRSSAARWSGPYTPQPQTQILHSRACFVAASVANVNIPRSVGSCRCTRCACRVQRNGGGYGSGVRPRAVGTPGVIEIVWAFVIGDDPDSAVSAVVSTLVIADDSWVGRLTREGGTDLSIRRDGVGLF